jgi:glycosyltransferase involved in cell wall biosynthesis
MDWLAVPAFFEVKSRGIRTPFYFHINSTQVDRSGGESLNDPTSRGILAVEKKGFTQAEKLAVVSEVQKQVLIQEYDIPEEKIFVVYNDITFEPENKGYEDLGSGKNILFIGRVTPQKGLLFLIDAAARVSQMDPQVRFIIAGDGASNGNMLPQIIEEVAKRGLERQVVFTGWVNTEAKKQLYKTCQLFVMPSPSEPFGLTALEAIRSGVPAIASNTSGFVGVVPSTPMFSYYDTEAFANMILHYLDDSKARNELLQKQENDLKEHNWSQEVQKVIHNIS